MIPWSLALPDRSVRQGLATLRAQGVGQPLGLRDASEVRAAAAAGMKTLSQLCDMPDYGVHRVFAEIYLQANLNLLSYFETLAEPIFCHLVVIRFQALYEHHVAQPVLGERAIVAPQWRGYARFAARSTMWSGIDSFLQLLALGARAHIRYDLADAICLAADDYRQLYGRAPDLEAERAALLDPATDDAFFRAALGLNAAHREREQGWRHAQLVAHAALARLFRPAWIAGLQAWRRQAWREAALELCV